MKIEPKGDDERQAILSADGINWVLNEPDIDVAVGCTVWWLRNGIRVSGTVTYMEEWSCCVIQRIGDCWEEHISSIPYDYIDRAYNANWMEELCTM